MSISRNPAFDGGQSFKIFSAGMALWVVAVIALALSGATI
jgi:hypothetical protein